MLIAMALPMLLRHQISRPLTDRSVWKNEDNSNLRTVLSSKVEAFVSMVLQFLSVIFH